MEDCQPARKCPGWRLLRGGGKHRSGVAGRERGRHEGLSSAAGNSRLFGSRAGGSHLPAWRRGARRDGRLDRRQVRKSRPGGHFRWRSRSRTAGRRESHGPRVRGLLDQPEAVRPVPRPLLARRRQGRQPRRPRPRRAMPSEASSSPGSSTSGPRFRRPRRPDGSIAGPLESRPSPSHPEPPRPRKRWRARDYKALRCMRGDASVTRRSGKYKLVVRRRAAHGVFVTQVYHWGKGRGPARHRQQGQVRRRSRPRPAFRRGPPARRRLRHAPNLDLLPAPRPAEDHAGRSPFPSAGQRRGSASACAPRPAARRRSPRGTPHLSSMLLQAGL